MTVKVEIPGYSPLQTGSCRVIAEAGANHNNSVERAIEMASRASSAGAWAIKFQLYKADNLAVRESGKYWSDSIGTRTQHEAFKLSDHLAYTDYKRVIEACERLGILFFATPFDLEAVETLQSFGVGIYKIASGDITHRPLLEAISQTGKPVLLSTGAATPDEIDDAIGWLGYGPDRLVLLACTLTYPTPDTDAHFARLDTFRERYRPFLSGFSDHTLGVAGAWMTAALGGVCIEKHYTLDKSLPDVPDHAMSVDPSELHEMVLAADRAAALRGEVAIQVRESEAPARAMARRSIVLSVPVKRGDVLTIRSLAFKRPGVGIPPSSIYDVIGKRVVCDCPADYTLQWADII